MPNVRTRVALEDEIDTNLRKARGIAFTLWHATMHDFGAEVDHLYSDALWALNDLLHEACEAKTAITALDTRERQAADAKGDQKTLPQRGRISQ